MRSLPSSPVKPPRPALDRAGIVQAALDLMQEEGIDALTTRRLAAAMGVSGPSLYWHFKSMGELKSEMADVFLTSALGEARASGDWRDWLGEGARAIRRAALSRKDGARLLAEAAPSPRRQSQWPPNLERLEAAGFASREARYAFAALRRYALGSALAEQAGVPSPDSERAFDFGLNALLDGLEAARSAAGIQEPSGT